MNCYVRVTAVAFCFLACSLNRFAQEQSKPLPFRTAIELALRNSAAIGTARADAERARATVAQSRNVYIPQMTVGAALGYSHGFPLSLEGSAPSLFNVTMQSNLYNAAQREYINAAKSDAETVAAQNADRRNNVI